jgi:hypothetical protein
MNYKDYNGFLKPFIVEHYNGTGVMEDPYMPKKVVGEFDVKEDAEKYAKELFNENNTPEEIKSTWCNNTYWVNVNTLSKKGKQLLSEFEKGFKNINTKDYEKVKVGEYTFNFKRWD